MLYEIGVQVKKITVLCVLLLGVQEVGGFCRKLLPGG